jgi:MazG family protein
MDERLLSFARLLDVMDQIRANCPWDKIQTIESLRHLTIEETYELSEAILNENMDEVKKELGDLMLHIVFYSKIASEKGAFDIVGVLNGISDKLIRRHPHVFGSEKAADSHEVSENWEKIKLQKEGVRSVLAGVPNGLPALLKAYRMQQKAAGVGFEWAKPEEAWKKVVEEKNELFSEIEKGDSDVDKEAEFGDLLFALINYARFIDVNPENALENTNKKFKRRFMYIEEQARQKGTAIQNLSLQKMMALWTEAKNKE